MGASPVTRPVVAQGTIDLDLAARNSDFNDHNYKGRRERTGTPMFISLELASKIPLKIIPDPYLQRLYARFEKSKSDEYIKKAFGDSDDATSRCNQSLRNFKRVVSYELERSKNFVTATTNPNITHLPRHDCESVYMIMSYFLARAFPRGPNDSPSIRPPEPVDDDDQDSLERFCDVMLQHRIGIERSRHKLHFSRAQEEILHADLKHFAPVLQHMAAYMYVPWHLYDNETELDHAHIAFRWLLLLEIAAIESGEVPDVLFSTHPRLLWSETGRGRYVEDVVADVAA
ncbi:hypothetical protein EXIGLDRAFT_699225 [Exidia glandulosa HHB12029]|uniref:Fungal-type protein kinase domain-containing protein n=1 Tax=Exidia glandulosa HHB12029 TaxID=1314781 RepID=A0A165QBA8_EXIGL|nr:hypothetical protein EXIGLDRAFT_699225 [Exidia glandulosa HHB12029]